MRVIAGRWRGRRLRTPRGSATRPTADRVREAVFSILGELEQARVLDLFAGSGALGIEALSRGAAHATFVDSSPAAAAAIRANLRTLEAERLAEVRLQRASGFLETAPASGPQYDLVFLDPPYAHAEPVSRALSDMLLASLAPGARVVTEGDRRAPLQLPGLELIHERRYGDTTIQIYLHGDPHHQAPR